MKYPAYWIDPQGTVLPVSNHHIDLVIRNPEIFGMTLQKIKNIYRRHKEPLYHEGFARNEIMLKLIRNGWVRVRYDSRTASFKFQIDKFSPTIQENIRQFVKEITGGKIDKVSVFVGAMVIDLDCGQFYWGNLQDILKNRF